MMKKGLIIVTFLLVAWQTSAQQNYLNGLVGKLQDHQQQTLQEKIFVHLDRPFYVSGETMWFSVYAMDGYLHQPVDVSSVAYIEVIDRQNQPVIQAKIKLEQGRGHGSVIIPSSLISDNYSVRAYTNWMKNFDPSFYFHQPITIVNVFQRLTVPGKASEPTFDLQFFPEGGQLIDGIKSKVAFRAVDATGHGIAFKGILLNNKGDTITTFQPLQSGIGNFLITPRQNENYKVIIRQPDGRITNAQLPPVRSSGYTLSITDTTLNRIKISVKGKDESTNQPVIYLIGHCRQLVKIAVTNNLVHGSITFLVDKVNLGEGINQFTVFDHGLRPVAERLYFNRPGADPTLKATLAQNNFAPRSKVHLNFASPESFAKTPLHASLSVYKNDSLQQITPVDIRTYLWLTSDLKGTIESPEYYLSDSEGVAEATDNLMLVHGWTRFRWNELLQNDLVEFRFLPEHKSHLISAMVLDIASDKPVQGIPAYLASPGSKINLHAAHSNAGGKVIFETNEFTGTKKLFAHTGVYQSTARMQIESPFSGQFSASKLPALNLKENTHAALTQRSIAMQTEDIFYQSRNRMRAEAKDSTIFYGKAPEQYRLDDYTRFPLMEEVLREYVKGVRLRKKDDHFLFKVLNAPRNLVFENAPLTLLDGVPVFDIDQLVTMDPLKVKSIDVVTSQYYFGKFAFDGIVSFRTYNADLGGFQFDPGTVILNYEGLQANKEFFAPRYELPAEQKSRLPDQRNLLYWNAQVTIDGSPQSIEFYTGDQTGHFQVIMQGITETGRPVHSVSSFTVKASEQ
jgi:hypothetical protein